MLEISKFKILECGDYSVCVQLNSSNESHKFAARIYVYYLSDAIVKPDSLLIYSYEKEECTAFKIIKALKAEDTVVLYTEERIPDEVKQLVLETCK